MTSAVVLVLNVDYSPLEVISWRNAIEKLVTGKVQAVENYAGRFIRSPSVTFAFPAVVRLVGKYVRRRVRLSRRNIISRDAFTCQYCGARPRKSSGAPKLEALTIDHVVPRSRAEKGWVTLPWSGERVRVTSWQNVLTACEACNAEKAARTPREARMQMRKTPRPPSTMDLAWMSVFQHRIPEEWRLYLPESSPWADYWTVELEG